MSYIYPPFYMLKLFHIKDIFIRNMKIYISFSEYQDKENVLYWEQFKSGYLYASIVVRSSIYINYL